MAIANTNSIGLRAARAAHSRLSLKNQRVSRWGSSFLCHYRLVGGAQKLFRCGRRAKRPPCLPSFAVSPWVCLENFINAEPVYWRAPTAVHLGQATESWWQKLFACVTLLKIVGFLAWRRYILNVCGIKRVCGERALRNKVSHGE